MLLSSVPLWEQFLVPALEIVLVSSTKSDLSRSRGSEINISKSIFKTRPRYSGSGNSYTFFQVEFKDFQDTCLSYVEDEDFFFYKLFPTIWLKIAVFQTPVWSLGVSSHLLDCSCNWTYWVWTYDSRFCCHWPQMPAWGHSTVSCWLDRPQSGHCSYRSSRCPHRCL